MKLQRQHFLLSYLKTLSVGPVGGMNSRPPTSQPGAQPSEPPVRGFQVSNCKSWNELRQTFLYIDDESFTQKTHLALTNSSIDKYVCDLF